MYRALYRKWRPQRFEDVVGQRAVVAALKNQVAAGRVGHAYLFTGVRGTGKTTCAKIFAKAVNCLNPQNGDPCGQCAACRGIDDGSILDVVEMDAASNNGVDDIRDLRDETAYTPSSCTYKVYIIDEVHMLSTAAFNALLKTLEEPPAHVIFILATTEIQKVPATIRSRCQRYDFTRISPEDIAGRVAQVAAAEQLSLTGGAAALIARLADGALRDALSILDTCAGVTANIDEAVVRRMAGVTDRSYLFRMSDAVAARDAAGALAELAALRQQSVDVKRLTEELIAHYRSLMLAALPGGQDLLSGVSPDEEALYLEKGPALGRREAGAILLGVPVGFMTAVFLAKVAPPKLAAVVRPADLGPQSVDVEDVPGMEHRHVLRSAQMVGGHRRSQPVLPLDHGLGAVQGSASLPSSAGHALDDALRVRIMVGVAVRDDDGLGAGQVVPYPLHVGQGPRSGVYVQETAVVLHQEPAGAAGLVHGGVTPTSGP